MNLGNNGPVRVVQGATVIELMMVTVLMVLLVSVYILYFRQKGSDSIGDQKNAAYYLAMGAFLEKFHMDARMARKITSTPIGCKMEINSGGGIELIEYSKVKGGVEREEKGKKHLFAFGKPPQKDAQFLFTVEEVGP